MYNKKVVQQHKFLYLNETIKLWNKNYFAFYQPESVALCLQDV